MKLLIGSHVSFNSNNQLLGSVNEALSYGANTFMIYTGAPQNVRRVDINNDLINKAKEVMKEHDIDINNLVIHAPYIINLANNSNIDAYKFSIKFLKSEIKRCESLGINKLVIHPGNHVGLGIQNGLNNIIKALNEIIEKDQKVIVCLELMAGKGSECGTTFEELKYIIDNVIYKDKIGICLDTCHLNDAGYNLNNVDQLLNEFDKTIGLDKLYAIHINDSKNIQGSKKDRHENIGIGTIGFNNLIQIIYHSKLENIPKILETPYIVDNNESYPPYKLEIDMIKNKKFDDNLINSIINYYNNKR
jgi:deoxyribonuclease-4